MKIQSRATSIAVGFTAALVMVGANSAFGARSPLVADAAAMSTSADIAAIERAADGRLLAIGRLDAVSRATSSASVLGQKFELLASPGNAKFLAEARVGRPVALF